MILKKCIKHFVSNTPVYVMLNETSILEVQPGPGAAFWLSRAPGPLASLNETQNRNRIWNIIRGNSQKKLYIYIFCWVGPLWETPRFFVGKFGEYTKHLGT